MIFALIGLFFLSAPKKDDSATPTPTLDLDAVATVVSVFESAYTPTPTMIPTFIPTVILTFSPMVIPTATPVVYEYAFSFYDPSLLGENCHAGNVVDGQCKNITHCSANFPELVSGGWRDYLGRGVAVPPSLLEKYPCGTELQVLTPPELIGIYTVVDICGGCEPNPRNDYKTDLDFLLPKSQGFSIVDRYWWHTPVRFTVINYPHIETR